VLDVVAGECRLATDACLELPEAHFARPTRLPAWNVKQLLAHMWRDMDRLRSALGDEPPEAADADAMTYWRAYDPAARGPEIAGRAREVAARFATGGQLAADFERTWTEGVALATGEPPDRLIATWGPTMRLDEFLATRVVEIAVHGLDLAHALDRRPWLSREGSGIVRRILDGLLDAELPLLIGWDELAFIEAGTGRRRLDEMDRAILGDLAERFPLLA
jgi:uncharacterized protein (TIGR03083 family)